MKRPYPTLVHRGAVVPAAAFLWLTLNDPLHATEAATPGDAGPADAPAPTRVSTTADALDDLFGDSLSPEANAAAAQGLREMADGVQRSAQKPELIIKEKGDAVAEEASLVRAFAAERILLHPREGCVADTPGRAALQVLELPRFPGVRPGFAACVRLRSTAQRPMVLSVYLVDARNHRVARVSDQVDFSQQREVDHVLSFPPVQFQRMGTHRLVVDLDGREVGRVALFDVRSANAAAR